MPKVFVAQDRITMDGLADALLRSRVSAKNRENALAEIRRANPGLDFSRMDAGTVVVIPTVEGLKVNATEDPAGRAADDQTERLTEGLDALVAAAEAGEERRRRETEEQLAALDAILGTHLPDQLPELVNKAESARTTLKTDARIGEQYLNVLRQARDEWLEELKHLRTLL